MHDNQCAFFVDLSKVFPKLSRMVSERSIVDSMTQDMRKEYLFDGYIRNATTIELYMQIYDLYMLIKKYCVLDNIQSMREFGIDQLQTAWAKRKVKIFFVLIHYPYL